MTTSDHSYQSALEAAAAQILAQNGTSTPTPVVPDDGIRRFTSRRKNVQFYIDEDIFEAVGAAPADFMEALGQKLEDLSNAGGMKQYEEVKNAISALLVPASRELFESRRSDFMNPITLNVVSEVGALLLSEVSGRPTSPPPPSAPAPGETGSTLTGGQLV